MKIAVNNHDRKADALVLALHRAGHEFVPAGDPADLLLIDLDPPIKGYQDMIALYRDQGAKVFLYPHGAGSPVLHYDGLMEPDPLIDANLVNAPGHAEFLRRIEYPVPTHEIGWTLCPQRPFRRTEDVQHVVFGPCHPGPDGWLPDFYRDHNARAFEQLLDGPWRVTVRHIGSLEDNGLWEADGVTFVDGRTSPQTAEIDVADAIVAAWGTYPALAIARGVPTVMYAQGTMALGVRGEKERRPARGERYADFIGYPFDLDRGPLSDLIPAAARDEAAIEPFRRRFIGRPFDARAFVALVERLVSAPAPPVTVDATRRVATLAFVDELIERPDLLRAYVARVSPRDDATLMLWTPGLAERELLALAEQAIDRAGLGMDGLPDILLVPLPGSPEADLRLSEHADALLSEWPAVGRIGALPRFDVSAPSGTR